MPIVARKLPIFNLILNRKKNFFLFFSGPRRKSNYTHTHTHTHIYIYIYIFLCKCQLLSHLWRQIDYNPKTGLYFRTCEDGAGWHLIPYRNKSCSEFFSQACKNWHITWGNNLGPDWPPLARGSKFHTITHPPGRFLLSPRQWKITSL